MREAELIIQRWPHILTWFLCNFFTYQDEFCIFLFFFFSAILETAVSKLNVVISNLPPDLQLISLVRTYWVYSWVPPVGKSCGIEAALQNLCCEERLKQCWFELIAFIVLTDSRANLRLLWSKHKTVFQQVSPLIKNSTANMVPII